jgi:hypothetical protein
MEIIDWFAQKLAGMTHPMCPVCNNINQKNIYEFIYFFAILESGRQGPTDRLNDKTICLSTTQGENGIYKHYDVHNLYGYSETIPTST